MLFVLFGLFFFLVYLSSSTQNPFKQKDVENPEISSP